MQSAIVAAPFKKWKKFYQSNNCFRIAKTNLFSPLMIPNNNSIVISSLTGSPQTAIFFGGSYFYWDTKHKLEIKMAIFIIDCMSSRALCHSERNAVHMGSPQNNFFVGYKEESQTLRTDNQKWNPLILSTSIVRDPSTMLGMTK